MTAIRSSNDLPADKVSEDALHVDHIGYQGVTVQLPIDPILEKKVMRKVDRVLVPWLWLIFLCNFIDRVNIGNARLQGLEKDLGLVGNQYNICLLIFFVPYIIFEVPSNLIIKKLRPSIWLSSLLIIWGGITIGQAFAGSFAGLVVCRMLLGFAEAGLFPGCVYLLSMYYKRWELQQRIVWFFSASIIAGSFGGLLAYAIAKMAGMRGINGWSWIFIIEGSITCVVGILSLYFISDFPEDNRFLTPEERAIVLARLKVETADATVEHLTMKRFLWIMRDWKIYISGFNYFFCVTTSYSIALALPSILASMGYTAVQAQLLSIGPYAAAFVASVTIAIIADHTQHRYRYCLIGITVAVIGYIIIMSVPARLPGVLYFATFLMITGAYISQPLILAWTQNNMLGHYKRSVSSAWTVSFGNISGIVASVIYTTPPFLHAYAIGLTFMAMCGVSTTIFWYFCRRENRKRDRGERDYRLQDPDIHNKGDDHPAFRFAL